MPFALKEYEDAEKHFNHVLIKYRYYWVNIGLARSLLKQEKFTEAQLLLNVIRSHIDLANSIKGDESATYLHEAEKYLTELAANPKYYRMLKQHIDVINTRLHCAKGEKSKTDRILGKLNGSSSRSADNSVENNLEYNFDLIEACHEAGNHEAYLTLLEESKNLVNDNMFSGDILNKYIEQEMDERSHIHFTPRELTEMAAACHTQQKYGQAMKMLDQAFRLSPRNDKLGINIMKVAASMSGNSQMYNDRKRTVNKAITMLKRLTLKLKKRKCTNNFGNKLVKSTSWICYRQMPSEGRCRI